VPDGGIKVRGARYGLAACTAVDLAAGVPNMNSRGYSLVEMVVVIGIVSILLAIGTLRFNEYMKRYRIEAQTRLIYSELLRARANALYQRRETRMKLYTNRFEVYSSKADSGAPIASQVLGYPIVWGGGDNVDFDERGMAVNNQSICLDYGDGSGAVNSVVIFKTRVSIGKKDKQDDSCEGKNITKW
jgi:prepilin-type N-terminal cleavage/methylation domain-containing protein